MVQRFIRTQLPVLGLLALASVASVASTANAQGRPPAPAPVPGTPQPKQWSADSSVPVSPTMQSLEARMEQMLSGKSGLTADEVARRAEATSPDVAAKKMAIDVQSAKVEQAGDQFYPKLVGTARYTRLSDLSVANLGTLVATDGTRQANGNLDLSAQHAFPAPLSFPIVLNNYVFQAQLTVPISDYVLRYSRALGAAKQSRRASELDEQASRLKVGADARIAYYQWIRAQGQLLVVQQAVEQAKGHLVDAQRSFDVGMVSKADVLRATSSLKASELNVARAINAQNLAEDDIRIAMHDDPGKKYEIGENILAPLPPMSNVDSVDKLQSEALQKRIEIRALDETQYSLREAAKLQKIGNLPRLDGQATALYANPNPRVFPAQEKFTATWDASIILTWTPTDIPLNNANVAETEARAAQVEAQKAGVRDALRLEVTQAWNALQEAEVALDTTHAALAASEENYRVRRDLYRNGRATSVELTDAETDLTRARLEAVNARIDARIARVRVNHAVGRDVPAK